MSRFDGVVADVGGTNTRMAAVVSGQLDRSTIRYFQNDAFGGFDAVASAFLADHPAPPTLVAAVAGPVAGPRAELTNRDWTLDAPMLAHTLGAGDVRLINDLQALGLSLETLPAQYSETLHAGAADLGGRQKLVVGLGTGFNVAATRDGQVLSSEFGQVRLPDEVAQMFSDHGVAPERRTCYEDVFCGPGLANVFEAMYQKPKAARDIGQGTTEEDKACLRLMAEGLGVALRELAFIFMPTGGMYLNGSLGRVLLSEPWRPHVLRALEEETRFDHILGNIPLRLITEDSAALFGCAQVVADQSAA